MGDAVCSAGASYSACVPLTDSSEPPPLGPTTSQPTQLPTSGPTTSQPTPSPTSRPTTMQPTAPPTPEPTTSPTSESTPDCTVCDDRETNWMRNKGFACATDTVRINNKCNKDNKWTKNKYCQLSCYEAGNGYPGDVCCVDDPSKAKENRNGNNLRLGRD